MAPTAKKARESGSGFSKEERDAVRETLRERRAGARGGKVDGERDLLAKVAEMNPSDRALAERLHRIVQTHAPGLSPKTWYGMPAYAKDDQVVLFFQPAQKFKTRYATLGFSDEATLDDGRMWPVTYALTELTGAEEAKVVALVKRATGSG